MTAKPEGLLRVAATVLTVPAVVLTACGSPASSARPDEPVASQAGSTLTVRLTPSPDASTKVWTLTCQPPGGSHPAPEAACATLTKLTKGGNPFEKPPKDQICTQIYGGPQKAKVEGVWRGETVLASYSRRNGCAIQRWESMQPVIAPGEAAESPAATPT